MNDANGKPLSVGQKVTFTERGNGYGYDEKSGLQLRKPDRIWTGTVEHLVAAGTSHPRGGGATLTSGKSYPAADKLKPEHAAAYKTLGHAHAFGKPIEDATPPHDMVIATIDPELADTHKVMSDHDLSDPCNGFGLTSDANDCPCPARMWLMAAHVVGE